MKVASAKGNEKSWKAGYITAEQLCEMLNGFKTNTMNKVHALSKIGAAVHLDGGVEWDAAQNDANNTTSSGCTFMHKQQF